MPAPGLKLWSFRENPFWDAYLRDKTLDLFVDRDADLLNLENALDSRITAVSGSSGIGKRSFLRKFAANLRSIGETVVLVRLFSDAADSLCREVLAEILALRLEGRFGILEWPEQDAAEQLARLDGTQAHDRISAPGAPLPAVKPKARLDEVGARRLLARITREAEERFVVVLDGFHSLGQTAGSYFPALERWITLVDHHFDNRDVSFVVALDQRFEQQSRAASKLGGAFSFGIGERIQLRPFAPEVLRELIRGRLSGHGWKGTVGDFLSRGAFYSLALCSEGHPSRALRLLRDAMKDVAKNAAGREGTKPRIELENVAAVRQADDRVDGIDLAIIGYLADLWPSLACYEELEKELEIPGSMLRKRLPKLHKSLGLDRRWKNSRISFALPKR